MIDLNNVYEITPQYLAGFFDGEGCITIEKKLRGFSLLIQFSQKDPSILILISTKFTNGNWNNNQSCVNLRYYGTNVKQVLEYIRPYVIVKKSQIEIALRFLNGSDKQKMYELIKQEKSTKHLII